MRRFAADQADKVVRGRGHLVLLHAFPLDERMWEPLDRQEAIAPRLYEPVSTMDEWADAVLEQVDGSFLACGASMGGYCALAIARRAPRCRRACR